MSPTRSITALLVATVLAAACGPSTPPVDRYKIARDASALADRYVSSYLDAFPDQAVVIGAREAHPDAS